MPPAKTDLSLQLLDMAKTSLGQSGIPLIIDSVYTLQGSNLCLGAEVGIVGMIGYFGRPAGPFSQQG